MVPHWETVQKNQLRDRTGLAARGHDVIRSKNGVQTNKDKLHGATRGGLPPSVQTGPEPHRDWGRHATWAGTRAA